MACEDYPHPALTPIIEPRRITKNIQLVTRQGEFTDILMPRVQMTREESINLAAYLIALNDAEDEFLEVLAHIKGQ